MARTFFVRSWAVWLVFAGGALAQETPGPAELSFEVPRPRVYVGEAFPLTVEFSFAEEFLEERLVPLLPRRLDLPVRLSSSWLESPPAGLSWELQPAADDGPRFALADEFPRIDRLPDRDERACFATTLFLYAERSGSWDLAPLELEYALAETFVDDPLVGRRPMDRKEETLRTSRLRLDVVAPPEAGRPARFAGAVGRFEIDWEVEAKPATPSAGASVSLRLIVEGAGQRLAFPAPRLDLAADEHLLGQRDEGAGTGRRVVEYQVQRRGGGPWSLPGLEFVYFDPHLEQYQVWTSPTESLTIAAASSAPDLPGAESQVDDDARAPWWQQPAAWIVAPVMFLAAWLLRNSSRRDPRDPRAPDPEPFSQRIRAGEDVGQVFPEYLASYLACPPQRIMDPQLAKHLEAHGVALDLAQEVHAFCEHAVGARFGGTLRPAADEEAIALMVRLQREL